MQELGDGSLIMDFANSVWISQNHLLQPEFEEAVMESYSAEAQPITTAEVGQCFASPRSLCWVRRNGSAR